MLRIGIVGVGPWGVCAVERVVTTLRRDTRPGGAVELHVIEPRTPGSGVYDIAQPDYLLLNNACGELSLYPFGADGDRPPYALGLFDWAVEMGYHWVGDRCCIDSRGAPIERHHFLPRRLMGEYLVWFYTSLVAAAPSNLQIVEHRMSAVDIVQRRDGSERIHFDDGSAIDVDNVILTSGHTPNVDGGPAGSHPRELAPYPVSGYVEQVPGTATVAVSGMGLVAIDVITALTVGRGGRFVDSGDGLRYERSGREPTVWMYSRSGLPFTAKPVTGVDRAGAYEPIVCTEAALDELRGGDSGKSPAINVRRDLLPLLYAEMSARYYAQLAYQHGELPAARAVRSSLQRGWHEGRFQHELDDLAARFGPFDPGALFFGHQPRYSDSPEYERSVYDAIRDDLREAEVPGGYSPTKSAADVFRIFRDPIRSVVEQGGPSFESYLDFNDDIRSRIHRLVAGPPALRSRQMLALMDANVVRAPFGPAPSLGHAVTHERTRTPGARLGSSTATRIASTVLGERFVGEADVVIHGRLGDPRIDGSGSELLSRLYASGRLSQFRYDTATVGSVDLTPDSHPISVDGEPQRRLWIFGVLTEGVRHFTQYLPSPRSRIRAVQEIGACVAEILQ
jgi:uncharacterized NAD(P)/FAD-binding protein YdhS